MLAPSRPETEKLRRFAPVLSCFLTVALLHSLFICHPFFQSNDDACLSLIVSGNWYVNHPDPHLLFSNIITGNILSGLYTVAPSFPWYAVLQYALSLLAFSMTAWVLFRRLERTQAVVVLLILFAFTTIRATTSMQFTVTAALLGLAAVAELIDYVERRLASENPDTIKFDRVAPSLICVSLSALVRPESAVLILLLAGFYFGTKFLSVKPAKLLVPLRYYFILVATVAILVAVNNAVNALDVNWRDFFAFNRVIAQVTDFRRMDNAYGNLPKLQSVGWSLNDVNLLLNWCFADKIWFSKQRILSALSVLPPINIKDLVWGRLLGLSHDQSILTTLAVLFVMLPFIDRSKFTLKQIALLLAAVFLLCAVMLAFFKLDQHVLFPMLCFILLLELYHFKFGLGQGKRLLHLLIWCGLGSVLLVAFTFSERPMLIESERRSAFAREFHECLIALHIQAHSLYFTWGLPMEILPPFVDPRAYLLGIRFLPFGGMSQSPLQDEALHDFACDSVSEAMLKPNAYLVNDENSRLPLLIEFYQEHYGKRIAFSRVAMLLPTKKLEVLKCTEN